MKVIEAYVAEFDNKIFDSAKAAKEYEENQIQEECDGLLKLFEFDCLSRRQEYNGLTVLTVKNRSEFEKTILKLAKLVAFSHTKNGYEEG